MLKVDGSVGTAYQEKMGILIIEDVSYSNSYPEHEIVGVFNELGQKYVHLERKELKEIYPVNAYIAFYKKFGWL